MNKYITALTNWSAAQIKGFAAFLESVGRPAATQSKFVNLAPTDQADQDGVYSEALLFATTDPNISNIALTGPYGSGKSSIIQSFLKKYQRPPLHISLAAFVQESGAISQKVSRQEIERSILQQMLYGADANKLPLSRFKRIQSPSVFSIFKSLYIILGIASFWYVFSVRENVVTGSLFTPFNISNWFNIGSFAFLAIFLWVTIYYFYVASFGLSLKSISLKDIEIRPAADDQESILNRHLDEIIYFFHSTKYDLVIIEDLDRFDDAEIFVTLREINRIVNMNAGIQRKIRFLYAIRDDVFENTERTKFFEFIIPVIPIINSSNSIDMVLKQGKRLNLNEHLDPRFLREVSRYLNDLRLIQNIFNEYAIYVASLEAGEEGVLNKDKLLAILIYKNVYPRDFEQLHRGEGSLAYILSRQDELIDHSERLFKSEIAKLEQRIEVAERQTPSDLRELRQIYVMSLVERLAEGVTRVSIDARSWIPLRKLVEHDAFENVIEAHLLYFQPNNNIQNTVDISNLQVNVDSDRTYLQRKSEIEIISGNKKNESLQRISELRESIAAVRTTKLNELIRSSAERAVDIFDGFGKNGELARFLILEGYIDDTYYQYTSLFHSGRLSPTDNKFLIQIRAFVTPDASFPIDNPKEIIAAMRDEDFGQSYVLNVRLVDSLLSEMSLYADQTRRLFEFIPSHFDTCEEFFEAYYATGRRVPGLLSGLASSWRQFVPTIIASKRNLSHVIQLLTSLPVRTLGTMASEDGELPEFVAANLPEILAVAPDLEPERLECIGFEVRDLSAIGQYTAIVQLMVKKGLFELSIANLEHVYREVLGKTDLISFRERNYTTMRSITDTALKTRIERDFELYLGDVLLKLHDNAKEDVGAIIDILCREELDKESLREFLGRQTALLPTLVGVPDTVHAMLFELRCIEPKWNNCIAFIGGSGFAAEVLVAYLDREELRTAILKQPLPSAPETLPLRQFLVGASALSSEGYRDYIRALPNLLTTFPDGIGCSKIRILIEESKVLFSNENLEQLDVESELPLLFVAKNIELYLADPNAFAIDDDFREALLRSDLNDDEKRAIIDLIDINALAVQPERAALIGPIIDRTDAKLSGLGSANARSLVLNSRPVETQISLFNKLHSLMTVGEAREILAALPRPFSEITRGYHTPRIPKSEENLQLVQWLDSRGIISSWSQGVGWFGGDDIRVNLKRR